MTESRLNRARPHVAAGALFFDEDGRIMLVKPTYKGGWDVPGGYVEVGETPRQGCIREVQEELSVGVSLGELLVVDWAPHPIEGDKLLFVFNGGVLPDHQIAAIELQTDELSEYSYRDPSAVSDLLIPRLARRITAAVQARSRGRTEYLEHGEALGALARDRASRK